MHLAELKTFLAIVETGSLVKASKQLNVTQSTVTARLKSLEDEIGQPLINRQKSGATLTAAGERLRRYANTISDVWRQALQETFLPDAFSSVCNIGCHTDLWPALGEKVFEEVRKEYAQVALSVWHGSEQDLTGWLDGGLTDISLTYLQNANQRQVSMPLIADRLVPVSTNPNLGLRSDPGYVFVEAGDEFGKWHAINYADAKTARISFGSAVLGLEHLLKFGGSAYLPERMVQQHIDGGRLSIIKNEPAFDRNAFVVANKTAMAGWPWFDDLLKKVVAQI